MKRSLLTVAFLALTLLSEGQSAFQNRPPLRERLFFGGGFGLTFGSITNIEVSPIVGVRVLPRLAVAGGPTFQYFADEFGEMTIYGGKGYVQFTLIQSLDNIIPLGLNTGIHLHGEYEGLSLDEALVSNTPGETGTGLLRGIPGWSDNLTTYRNEIKHESLFSLGSDKHRLSDL